VGHRQTSTESISVSAAQKVCPSAFPKIGPIASSAFATLLPIATLLQPAATAMLTLVESTIVTASNTPGHDFRHRSAFCGTPA